MEKCFLQKFVEVSLGLALATGFILIESREIHF